MIATALLFASIFSLSARNGSPTLHDVQIKEVDVARQNEQMHVAFVMDLTNMELGKNEQVIYTPVLTSADGTQQIALDKIVLNGRNISILEERSPKIRVQGAATTVRRVNGTRQEISYSKVLPYSAWMDNSTLYLAEDLCGCGDLQSQDRMELASMVIELPEPVVRFEQPQVEQTKMRTMRCSASVDFPVNSLIILPDYRNNRAEIDKVISSINVVKNDCNVEITNIAIHGYASPEGSYEHNAYLAENRTKALTDYVKGLYDIPADRFTIESTPENWDDLREFVEGSDLPHRTELLEIIDNPSLKPDVKDWRMKLRYPDDYRILLQTVYPSLRRSDFTISYLVRPFTVEEALEVMKVSPKQVSLHEMFTAAQTLGTDTEEYKEMILLAAKTYPDEPVANYNAAVVMVGRGDYDSALSYLNKVPESGNALNLKGVVALKRGKLDVARDYFQQAAAQGMTNAVKNIEIIDLMHTMNK